MEKENLINKAYIAKAYAIKKIDNNNIKKLSSPLDIFLVIPIIKRNFYNEEIIEGYRELITQKDLIYRKNYKDIFKYEDYDIISKNNYQEGDLYWEVISKVYAINIMDENLLNNYLLKSSDDINYELKTIRNYAKKIANTYNKIHTKKR